MRVLLVEAQALVREGLKQVTLQIDATCEFIEAADAATARAVLRKAERIDAAWIDAALVAGEDVAAFRCDRPDAMLLVLTSRADAALDSLLAVGINALVPKSASTDILAAALRLTVAGDVWVRGSHTGHVYASSPDRTALGSRRGAGPLNLTSRQYDVLELIAQDRPNKAIAGALGIGLRTVKGHMSVILRALHVDNRADAGRAARRCLARAPSTKGPSVLSA